ncbi:MAG: J domain-containing protein [Halobacteria archaeon]|nr:J domain-containing protein [Halobacteria archaeon]
MEEKEAYEVLGVSNGASREEIQQAYREKVKEFHPDISDHDEALTKFKRVKEAYETLGSRRVSEFQGGESDEDSEAGKDTRTDERTNDKVNLSSSTETTSERTTAGDEGGEEPEGFETVKQYGQGWRLAFEEDGCNWFVFKEYETSPYTDEKEMIYLDSRGEESESPVYFGSRGRAEEAYLEGFGKGDRRAEDKNGTGESEDGDTDGGWSDVQEENRLDPLWVLYSQTKKERGKIRRRWGVGTDVTEDNRFINADGEYQEDEFWFDEREEKGFDRRKPRGRIVGFGIRRLEEVVRVDETRLRRFPVQPPEARENSPRDSNIVDAEHGADSG